jgi:hypothetical protein
MKETDEYKVCSLEEAEAFAQKRNITVTMPESYWEAISKAIDVACYEREIVKPNYVAEAPYQPGYEDAVVTEPKPFLCGIYKPKPLTNEEITGIRMQTEGDIVAFARAIERRHGIK